LPRKLNLILEQAAMTTKTLNRTLAFVAGGLFFASLQAGAAELLVTPVTGKSGNASVALDIVSDGNVSGFQFSVNLGKVAARSADLSKCVADLPAGFSGECRLADGKVNVFVLADKMISLPAGPVSVGSIGFAASDMAKAGGAKFNIENLEFVDAKGQVLPAASSVE
jgi:hypothetical protein